MNQLFYNIAEFPPFLNHSRGQARVVQILLHRFCGRLARHPLFYFRASNFGAEAERSYFSDNLMLKILNFIKSIQR